MRRFCCKVLSCSRQSPYKPYTKWDKYSCGYQRPFLVNWFVTFLLNCMFGTMIQPRLKSSIPAELNHPWSLFQRKLCILAYYNLLHIRSFLQKLYFAHAQTVCTRPLTRGRGLGMRLECMLIISNKVKFKAIAFLVLIASCPDVHKILEG